MKKALIVGLSILLLVGCDNKKGLELTSSDSYTSIAAKTNLLDKREQKTYYLYETKDSLKSFDNIIFNPSFPNIILRFSNDGKLCGVMGLASTEYKQKKNEVIDVFNKTKNMLENYGIPDVSRFNKNNLTWHLNKQKGIKYLNLDLATYEDQTFTGLNIVTDNERYCYPEVMEREKKGE